MTIKESQSVITWDFDVMKSDVQFTVFRHKRPREAVSNNSLSSFGSDVSLNQSGVIAGVDAVVVEKPRHCFDGESIQVRVRIVDVIHPLLPLPADLASGQAMPTWHVRWNSVISFLMLKNEACIRYDCHSSTVLWRSSSKSDC